MAKQKKKPKRNPILGRSDIPYAQRMAMKHQADIAYNFAQGFWLDRKTGERVVEDGEKQD